MKRNKIEFAVGDEVTFKPYEKEVKAIVKEVDVSNVFEKDERIFYKLGGDAVSVTTGKSIMESEYFEPSLAVHFRKFPDGAVVALFPDLPATPPYITSYQHIGQHSDASKELLLDLPRATITEYASLLKELNDIGYDNLIVA